MSIVKVILLMFIASLPLMKPTEGLISTVGCGRTVGCLRSESGCDGTNCDYAATYIYQPSTKVVTIEMFGKDAAWVAIGFSDNQAMPQTHAVFCYNLNGNVTLESSNLQSRRPPTLEKENELDLLESSMEGGISCKFNHPLVPTSNSTLRSLDQKIYLLYAKGTVSGGPIQHSGSRSARGFSAELVNLTTTFESGTTTPSPMMKPTEGLISTVGCGRTVGCLRSESGCDGTNCDYAATYIYQPSTKVVTIEMFGKGADWVAIGFSDNQAMPQTHAVFCYNLNGNVTLESSNLQSRRPPTLEKENELDLLESSMEGGISCKFNHPLVPTSNSTLRSLDQNVYLLYAKGAVSGGPIQHSSTRSARGFSAELVNITTTFESGTTTPSPLMKSTREMESSNGLISTVGCGRTFGCLRFEAGCDGTNCDYAATYIYQPSTKVVTIVMFGKDAAWVAIGFSDNQAMPQTHAVFCYNSNGNVTLESSNLQSKGPPTLEKENELDLLESSIEGGISCKFNHPLVPTSNSTLRSLDQKVYLLYAKGAVSGGPIQHSSTPSARGFSEELVNLTTTFESGTTSPSPLKKKVHGSLMAIVWILLASSGLFFARYTRDNWPDTKPLGTKVWFQFHRFLMILVVLGTIASIVVIFVDLDGFTEQEGKVKTHAIIGLVVLALAVLQPIGALFRPHPDAPKRPIFNLFHRTFGVSAFVLAIVAIILGLDIFDKDKAYYTVIGYVGFVAGVFVIMEISKCLYERAEESINKATVPGGMQMQIIIAPKSSVHLTLSQIFLVIVDIVSLAVTVAVIYFITQDDEN